jgi:hypothetical protein
VITFPDADQDGFFANVDCNDANAAIHPGAAEILGNAVDENCDGVATPFPPTPRLGSVVTASWLFFPGKLTRVTTLVVKPVPAGTTVTLSCTSAKHAKKANRCPFRKKTIAVKAPTGKLSLAKYFKKRKLAPGTKIEVRATKPGTIGVVSRYTTRNRKIPSVKNLCLPPGATTAGKC